VSLRQRITPARLLGSVNSGSASLVGAPCRSGPPLGVYSHSFSDSRAVFAIMALLILALLAVMTMLTDQAIDAADRDGGSP